MNRIHALALAGSLAVATVALAQGVLPVREDVLAVAPQEVRQPVVPTGLGPGAPRSTPVARH